MDKTEAIQKARYYAVTLSADAYTFYYTVDLQECKENPNKPYILKKRKKIFFKDEKQNTVEVSVNRWRCRVALWTTVSPVPGLWEMAGCPQ